MDDLGVIFDMDGVLIDSYDTHLRAWQLSAEPYGLTVDAAAFHPLFGRKGTTILNGLWPGRFNDEQARAFDTCKQAKFRELLAEHFPTMDGAGELIKALSDAGFRLAIGSSGAPESVEMVRRLIPNGQLISATVNGHEVKEGKPHPQVFLVAAERLGLPPGNCAVIEDALAGLEAARRAGAAAIGMASTESEQTLAAHADLVISSLRELSPQRISMAVKEHGGRSVQ
jgi:beta-phosphoglucomutase